jgi:hypothetical protein
VRQPDYRRVKAGAKGACNTELAAAGVHVTCAQCFRQRDVALVGSGTHGQLMPSPVAGIPFPVHQLQLIAMGTPMFDNCDLEALGRSRQGSPVNSIAIF